MLPDTGGKVEVLHPIRLLSRTARAVRRSMAAGQAGLGNAPFYMDETMMVFGDARKVAGGIVKAF